MTTDFRPVLLVPVYNHGAAFARMFEKLGSSDLPIIAVDDGSLSETHRILDNLAAEEAQLTLLRQHPNQGKGAAVILGIRHAAKTGFTHVLQIDADEQHDISDIERFIETARAHPDSVILGQPIFDDSVPRSRLIGRYLTHVWIWIETLSFEIRDSMCGFRLYPVEPVIPLLSSRALGQRMDFDPEILVRLHWAGTHFVNLATRVVYPEGGQSNFRLLQDNLLITAMHIRLSIGMLWRLPVLLSRRLKPRNRSADQHWAGIAERGSLLGLRFLFTVYRIFGRRIFQGFAAIAAGYFLITAGPARRASRQFLDQVWAYSDGQCGLPGKPGLRTSYRHFFEFTEAVLDKIAGWLGEISYQSIDHENRELFDSRQRGGLGGIWVTSHLGNVEVCRAIGQQHLGLKLTVLIHTRHAENFNRLLSEVAPDSNVELMQVMDFDIATALKLKKRLNQGHFIVIVGDRTPVGNEERVIECDFLGRRARFPTGPFLLATLLDCPAGTLFCVREGQRFRLFFEDLPDLQSVSRDLRQSAVENAALVFAMRLEKLSVRYPLQWFNFFPFWNDGVDSSK